MIAILLTDKLKPSTGRRTLKFRANGAKHNHERPWLRSNPNPNTDRKLNDHGLSHCPPAETSTTSPIRC